MQSRLLPLILLLLAGAARAQTPPTGASTDAPAPAIKPAEAPVALDPLTVTGELDQARATISPDLGATAFSIDQRQLQNLPLGDDASFGQVLLRAPGVAQDAAEDGGLHVRGEHANLQYRINDVLLPEGITGFGLELDPRFVEQMQLITGALPAQYGFRTAGIVDIQTKSGAFENGGTVDLLVGSFDTIRPSFEIGGSEGNASYFVDGSFDHNALGIENPASSRDAIHDNTDQARMFAYESYILDSTSRLNVMVSGAANQFQIPDNPNATPTTAPGGSPWEAGTFNPSNLNENQYEKNYYGVVSWQKSDGPLNLQLSTFGRNSDVHFKPDQVGDVFFNGVASDVERDLDSGGLQADGSFALNPEHTLRGGGMLLNESVAADSTTTVLALDAAGNPTGSPFPIVDNHELHGLFAGAYLQDEWKITPTLTVNYGTRFDVFDSSFDDESQLSPRINLIWTPTATTTLHVGYARYFTPPPVEDVPSGTLAKFTGTSNAATVDEDDPVKAERSNYFDAGVSQKLAPGWTVGVDGYYKYAKNQLDDGLFGQSLILSAFNYAEGRVYGVEFTTSYADGGFSTYGNLAFSVAQGIDWNSAQFLFDPADLAYVKNHWIYLDHDQRATASSGAAYTWKEMRGSTRVFVDALYGSGLRQDATASDGSDIPNGGSVPAYITANVGVEQTLITDAKKTWKLRLDVLNVADTSYELRSGSGVGVNAAQFGARLGVFGSVGLSF